MWVFATEKENFYRQVMTGGMHLTFASSELTLNTITLAKSLVVKTTHFNLTMLRKNACCKKTKNVIFPHL